MNPNEDIANTLSVTPEGAARILAHLDRIDRVKKFSDTELSNLVIDKVWGQVNLGSEEDALLDELITRFDAAKGIVRGEDGEAIEMSHFDTQDLSNQGTQK